VRRLSPDAQAAARAGAVIGRSFAPAVLAGVMDLSVESIDAPLEELMDHQILDRTAATEPFDFRHQLLRDAIYRTIPPGELRRLHARAAEFRPAGDGSSEIHASLHFERARMRDEAHQAALVGARKAAMLSANRESTELYARAVANLPLEIDAASEASLLAEYMAEAVLLEESELVFDLARRAREKFLAAGDGVGAADALLAMTTVWRWDGHPLPDRLATIRQAIEELEAHEPSDSGDVARLNAYSQLAWACIDDLDLRGRSGGDDRCQRHCRTRRPESGARPASCHSW
jgi:hypothetical protein